MRIRTVIDGREIEGYWNGKFYRSEKEGFAKIYIDGKPFLVEKDSFTYEEVLTEKQKEYAKSLKEKFLEQLRNAQVDKDIVEYFKKKEPEFYLKKKEKLQKILAHLKVKLNQVYFKKLFIENENIYEIRRESNPENRPSEEELIKAFKGTVTYWIENFVLFPYPKEVEVMLGDDGYFYFQDNPYMVIKVDVKKGTYQTINSEEFSDFAEKNLKFKWEAESVLRKVTPSLQKEEGKRKNTIRRI